MSARRGRAVGVAVAPCGCWVGLREDRQGIDYLLETSRWLRESIASGKRAELRRVPLREAALDEYRCKEKEDAKAKQLTLF